MKKFIVVFFIFVSNFFYGQSTKQKDYYTMFRCDTVDTEFVEEYFIIQLSKRLDVEYLVVNFKPNSKFVIDYVEYMKKGSKIKYRSSIELAEFFLGKEN